MTDQSEKDQGSRLVNFIVTVPAIAIGAYVGLTGLIPLAIIAACWWAVNQVTPEARKEWAPATAIHLGYSAWFIIAIVFAERGGLTGVDIAITLGGAAWLFFRPGAAAMIALSLYHLAGIGYHGYQFYTLPLEFGTGTHKALTVHVVIRATAIGTMAYAWYKDRKAAQAGEADPAPSSQQQES